MQCKELEFIPVILGGDITTYSLARSFHEEYQIRSIAISTIKNWLNSYSSLIQNLIVPNMEQEEVFLETLVGLGRKYPNKKLILMACGDWYVRRIAEHRVLLEQYYVIPYIPEELMNRLVYKDSFYQLCDRLQIPYPQTYTYQRGQSKDISLPFRYPIIAKPANSAQYHYAKFPGKKKVFKLEDAAALREMLQNLETSSYRSKFLLQDMIPGDDTFMHILTCYCDRKGKVRFYAFGQTLLEEKGDMAIGNPVAIINQVNPDVMKQAATLLEEVGYTGFANFDLKFDVRDGSYRFFEINTRLGRSNFYITGSGFNAVKWIVEDLVYQKEFSDTPVIADRENLYTVVPKSVILRYVQDPELKEKVKRLYREGRVANPIRYKGEKNLIHNLYALYYMFKQRRRFGRYFQEMQL